MIRNSQYFLSHSILTGILAVTLYILMSHTLYNTRQTLIHIKIIVSVYLQLLERFLIGLLKLKLDRVSLLKKQSKIIQNI